MEQIEVSFPVFFHNLYNILIILQFQFNILLLFVQKAIVSKLSGFSLYSASIIHDMLIIDSAQMPQT